MARQNDVEVLLFRHPETQRFALQVRVRSKKKAKERLWSRAEIDPGKAEGPNHLQQMVHNAAAGVALYLNANYGDTYNEVRVGKVAEEVFLQVMEQYANNTTFKNAENIKGFAGEGDVH